MKTAERPSPELIEAWELLCGVVSAYIENDPDELKASIQAAGRWCSVRNASFNEAREALEASGE